MKDAINKESKCFDRRVVDRYINRGTVKPNELQDHIKHLPDEAPNAIYVQLDLHDTELGDATGEHQDASSIEET